MRRYLQLTQFSCYYVFCKTFITKFLESLSFFSSRHWKKSQSFCLLFELLDAYFTSATLVFGENAKLRKKIESN